MIKTQEANWELYYEFENIIHNNTDIKIKKILNQFNVQDFQEIPIIDKLISYKKIKLLKYIASKNIPFTYEDEDGATPLHVACGAGGSLKCVKFLIENNLITDIAKKSEKFGDTPLILAICYYHKDIVNYFRKKFGISSISLDDLDIIVDRITVNFLRSDWEKWKDTIKIETIVALEEEDTVGVIRDQGVKKYLGPMEGKNIRPDVIIVKKDGKVKFIEVVSESQRPKELIDKLAAFDEIIKKKYPDKIFEYKVALPEEIFIDYPEIINKLKK